MNKHIQDKMASPFEDKIKEFKDILNDEYDTTREEDFLKKALEDIYQKGYDAGLENGWKLSNNNIKEVLKPWFKGVHNIKLPKGKQ